MGSQSEIIYDGAKNEITCRPLNGMTTAKGGLAHNI